MQPLRVSSALLLIALVILQCIASIVADTAAVTGPLTDADAVLRRTRVSTRRENNLNMELSNRASLLFRSMDHDHDKRISEEDVRQSGVQLAQHLPHVGVEEFLSFMEVADKDGDKMLDLEELLKGLSDGLQEARDTMPPAPKSADSDPAANLLETGATTRVTTEAERRRADDAARMRFELQRSLATDTDQVKGGDDDCVMCQYIIERCEANIKQSGVLPGFSSVAAFDSYLELDQQITPSVTDTTAPAAAATAAAVDGVNGLASPNADDVSLLEVQSTATATATATTEATAEHKQLYFDQTAAGIIGSSRQATRVQRQLERQKYNEVYRVTDLSLDDVCEQGMPIKFYGICKKIYKLQSDVVDGLRYQYRPADICFRISLCPKGSYITTGVHSRYKGV
jgi:hypothetical protein